MVSNTVTSLHRRILVEALAYCSLVLKVIRVLEGHSAASVSLLKLSIKEIWTVDIFLDVLRDHYLGVFGDILLIIDAPVLVQGAEHWIILL